MKPTLTLQDFELAAAQLGCETAAIQAVAEVESAKSGFFPDDFPKTLFEGHVFHRYTNGLYAATHPTLCYAKWTKKFYGKTWQEERQRLEDAIRLNRTAALMAASWGKFQIMGFNHTLCGCLDVQQFVDEQCKSEAAQLRLFCEYIVHASLLDELIARDWARFARLYNGPLYYLNQYDTKLAKAYAKFKGIA